MENNFYAITPQNNIFYHTHKLYSTCPHTAHTKKCADAAPNNIVNVKYISTETKHLPHI